MATTTTSDSQKQLLSLIRDFAAEKSHGEKRVFNLKKRIDELQSEVEHANTELESTKRVKETAEQELKGYEVELSISETSIQTLETRIASIQDEISKVGSDVDTLKNKEAALREEFISQMVKFKSEIRSFHDLAFSSSLQRSNLRPSSDGGHNSSKDAEFLGLEKKIAIMVDQTATEEVVCEREQNLQNQLHQELSDSRRRLELTEAIMKDTIKLQDFTQQTSELEKRCAIYSEQLQQKCICPACHLDNSEALAELLQENGS